MRATVKLLLDAVEERGLSIRLLNGRATLHGDTKEVTPELLAAMKHFRAEILEAKQLQEETPPPPEPEAQEAKREPPTVPDDATVVVMDRDGYTDKNMKSKAYMWTYIGAPTWWYVADFPVPVRKKVEH